MQTKKTGFGCAITTKPNGVRIRTCTTVAKPFATIHHFDVAVNGKDHAGLKKKSITVSNSNIFAAQERQKNFTVPGETPPGETPPGDNGDSLATIEQLKEYVEARKIPDLLHDAAIDILQNQPVYAENGRLFVEREDCKQYFYPLKGCAKGYKIVPFFMRCQDSESNETILVESFANGLCVVLAGCNAVVAWSNFYKQQDISPRPTAIFFDRDAAAVQQKIAGQHGLKILSFPSSLYPENPKFDINDLFSIDRDQLKSILSELPNIEPEKTPPPPKKTPTGKTPSPGSTPPRKTPPPQRIIPELDYSPYRYQHNHDQLSLACWKQNGNKYIFEYCPFCGDRKKGKGDFAIYLDADGIPRPSCFSPKCSGKSASPDKYYAALGLNLWWSDKPLEQEKQQQTSQLSKSLAAAKVKRVIRSTQKINSVMDGLKSGVSLAIEAPTGTGKTHQKSLYTLEVMQGYISMLESERIEPALLESVLSGNAEDMDIQEKKRYLDVCEQTFTKKITLVNSDNGKVASDKKKFDALGVWKFLVAVQTSAGRVSFPSRYPVIITNFSYLRWRGESGYIYSVAVDLFLDRCVFLDEAEAFLTSLKGVYILRLVAHTSRSGKEVYTSRACQKSVKGGCLGCGHLKQIYTRELELKNKKGSWDYGMISGRPLESLDMHQLEIAGYDRFLDSNIWRKFLDQEPEIKYKDCLRDPYMSDDKPDDFINARLNAWQSDLEIRSRYLYRPQEFFEAILDKKTREPITRSEALSRSSFKDVIRPQTLPCYTRHITGMDTLPAALLGLTKSVVLLAPKFSDLSKDYIKDCLKIDKIVTVKSKVPATFACEFHIYKRMIANAGMIKLLKSIPVNEQVLSVYGNKKKAKDFRGSLVSKSPELWEQIQITDGNDRDSVVYASDGHSKQNILLSFRGSPALVGQDMPELNYIFVDAQSFIPLHALLAGQKKGMTDKQVANWIASDIANTLDQIFGRALRTLQENLIKGGTFQDNRKLIFVLYNASYDFLLDYRPDSSLFHQFTYKLHTTQKSLRAAIAGVGAHAVEKTTTRKANKKPVTTKLNIEARITELYQQGKNWSQIKRALNLTHKKRYSPQQVREYHAYYLLLEAADNL